MVVHTGWIFTIGAGLYDALTAGDPWRGHCRDMAHRVSGPRVLDLGVGPGVSGIEMARAAPGKRLIGLDRSASMLRRAKRHARAAVVTLPLVRADASRLPFGDGSFDGATGHSILYLLPDGDAALREVHRVLRPGGAVAFFEPSRLSGLARARAVQRSYHRGARFGTSMLLWSVFSALHGRYSPTTLAEQLQRCGFLQPSVTSAFGGLGLLATACRR
jgi:ubiquinone/menaquinone biosynthesis C-methylase UbiE